ncbi:MAG: CRISPR-associated endoribonuclease Cas6 [Candidatus Magnetoovum sp. WYHC-5]|nr:CRISPR-associated endoribonuclease Cas6 [Candidatus Magnetoovum sp. WYHC-5]
MLCKPHKGSGEIKRDIFTFSNLIAKSYSIENDVILFKHERLVWYISSPVRELLDVLVDAVLHKNNSIIHIGNEELSIEEVSYVKDPRFTNIMAFTTLSPLTVSKRVENNYIHYIRYNESDFADAIKTGLINKYRLIYGYEPRDTGFGFEFDRKYIERREGKIQKKIQFLKNNIIAYKAPFVISGNPELIKLGYEAGFGERCNMGFGMAKIIE